MFFYLYLKTYTVLRTEERLFRWHLFFVERVDLWTIRNNGLTLFSISVLSYRNLAVYLNRMTEVCVFCAYVCVHLSVCAWATDVTGCIANWISPVLQVRKGRVPLVKKEKITACSCRESSRSVETLSLSSGLIWCISSFLLYRTTVPFKGTFCQYILPTRFMYVTQ